MLPWFKSSYFAWFGNYSMSTNPVKEISRRFPGHI